MRSYSKRYISDLVFQSLTLGHFEMTPEHGLRRREWFCLLKPDGERRVGHRYGLAYLSRKPPKRADICKALAEHIADECAYVERDES